MALPNQIDNATPPGTQSPSLGDDRIRELKTAIQDILGIPNATNVSDAGFTFAATGLTNVVFRNAAANPDAAGELQRNGNNLLFYNTSARTIAFLESAQTFDPGSQSGTASVQAVAGDITFAAGYGSSTSTAPVYGAGVMGNAISTANMTATANILAGVIGKYDMTGTNASTYPKAAVIGEVGDNSTTADAAVMAVLGGDTAASTADAAFAVDILSSTAASGFAYGVDLYRAAHDGYLAAAYSSAAIRVPNAAWIVARNAAGSADVNMIRIDSSNAIALGAALPATSGGTGLTSGTSGGVPYFSAATTIASSGALTANGVVYGGGAGAAPASTAQGGTRTILTANAGVPAFSAAPIINTSVQIGVVSSTTGSLSLANSSSALLTTFQAGNATEANTYVWPADGGAANQVLTTDGATPTTALSWTTVASSPMTREGGSATEVTTTSTTIVNGQTFTSLSIPTTSGIWITGRYRKTSGDTASISLGLVLNSTEMTASSGFTASSAGNENNFGTFEWIIPPLADTTYAGVMFRAVDAVNGTSWINAANIARPNATITTVTIRMLVGSASITGANNYTRVFSFT